MATSVKLMSISSDKRSFVIELGTAIADLPATTFGGEIFTSTVVSGSNNTKWTITNTGGTAFAGGVKVLQVGTSVDYSPLNVNIDWNILNGSYSEEFSLVEPASYDRTKQAKLKFVIQDGENTIATLYSEPFSLSKPVDITKSKLVIPNIAKAHFIGSKVTVTATIVDTDNKSISDGTYTVQLSTTYTV